jgi:hypothetical protein
LAGHLKFWLLRELKFIEATFTAPSYKGDYTIKVIEPQQDVSEKRDRSLSVRESPKYLRRSSCQAAAAHCIIVAMVASAQL